MEKIITIEGNDIKFESNGRTLRLYRTFFHRDMMKDLNKLYESYSLMKNKDMSEEEASIKMATSMDFEMIENLAWICAKTANNAIPDIDDWLSQFQNPLSLMLVGDEIISCIVGNMENFAKSKKNLKNTQKKVK